MAIETDLDDAPIIIGNDHTPRLTGLVDGDGAAITDWTGWTSVKWFLRTSPNNTTALAEKSATRVGNTWVGDLLTDTETELLAPGTRHYSWKRMDAGLEADLAYGKQPVVRTASR